MDNQEFIEKISSALKKYYDEIDWEDVAKNCNLINIIGSYSYDKNNQEKIFVKCESINKIISNVFKEDNNQLLGMLSYIELTYSFIIDEFIFRNIEKILKEYEYNPIKVFISYSSNNIEQGKRIYNFFKKLDFDCFLAECSLEPSEIFPKQIFYEIVTSDIYLLLYSADYVTSEWCNQEAGISFFRSKINKSLVFPICLDKTPRGFLNNVEGEKYGESPDFLFNIGEKIDNKLEIKRFSSKLNLYQNQIDINLSKLENENDENKIFQLFTFFKNYSDFMSENQVRKILFKYSTYSEKQQFLCEYFFNFLVQSHQIDINSLNIN